MPLADSLVKLGVEGMEALSRGKSNGIRLLMDTFAPLPTAIEKRFGDVGVEFVTRYKSAKDVARMKVGSLESFRRKNLEGVTDEAYESIAKSLDGQGVEPSDVIGGNAYRSERAVLDAAKSYAEEAGINTTGYVDSYFPQITKDPEKIIRPGKDREQVIQDWIKQSGRPREVVERALNAQLSRSIRLKRYGPLDYHRELKYSNENRRFDKDVITDYLEGWSTRSVFAKTFGPNNEWVTDAAAKITDYEERKAFISAANHLLGIPQPQALAEVWGGDLARVAQSAVVRSMMTLSAMNNTTQGAFGAVVRTNLISTAKAIKSYWSGADDEFLRKAHIITKSLENAFDIDAKDSKFLEKTLFTTSENFARTVAALSQKYYFQDALIPALKAGKPFAFREAKRLGVDAQQILKRGFVTEKDLLKAAIRMVDETQFLNSAKELPVFAHNPLGKILYTLWGYNIHWADFVRKYVIDEARNKNFMPMAKLIGSGYFIGAANRGAWEGITGNKRKEETKLQNLINNVLFSGGFGIVSDSIQSAQRGKPFMPPSWNLANEIGTAGYSVVPNEEGEVNVNPLLKTLGRRVAVPVVISKAGFIPGFLARLAVERLTKTDNSKYTGMEPREKRIAMARNRRANKLAKIREKRGF